MNDRQGREDNNRGLKAWDIRAPNLSQAGGPRTPTHDHGKDADNLIHLCLIAGGAVVYINTNDVRNR